MRIDVGVVGGTGTGDRLLQLDGTALHVPTAEGMLRGKCISHRGVNVLVMSRHMSLRKVPPHRVNYAALALGLKALGVRFCLSTAAVGSLREDWVPGTLAVCSDFIDTSARNLTLFSHEISHRDFSEPFGPKTRAALLKAAEERRQAVYEKCVYMQGNGPRYETPHEVQTFRAWGGDVAGMTAASEAIVMREAGIDYSCLAVVTNLACGISRDPLSHEEVIEQMNRSGQIAVNMILSAAERLGRTS